MNFTSTSGLNKNIHRDNFTSKQQSTKAGDLLLIHESLIDKKAKRYLAMRNSTMFAVFCTIPFFLSQWIVAGYVLVILCSVLLGVTVARRKQLKREITLYVMARNAFNMQ